MPDALTQPIYDGTHARRHRTDSTLALWRLTEGGGNPVDATGNYTLTLTNGAAWSAGDIARFGDSDAAWGDGYSLSLDGVDDVAAATGLLDTIPAAGFTIAFWFQPTTTFTGGSGPRLVMKFTGVADGFDVYLNTDGTLIARTFFGGSDYKAIARQATWLGGRSYFVAFVVKPLASELWVDGILVGKVTTPGLPGNGSTTAFTIGAFDGGGASYSNFFGGKIGPIEVASRPWSAEEIRAAYQQRRLAPVKSAYSRWTDLGTVLAPSATLEGIAVFEPHPIVDETGAVVVENDGSMGLLYTGILTTCGVFLATSTDGETFTKYSVNPLIGVGHGGQTGHACRNFGLKYGGTYYVWAADDVGGGRNDVWLYTASSRTGPYTKSASPAFTGVTGTWFRSPANVSVWRQPSGTWFASVASQNGGIWQSGLFTAASPSGPWTPYDRQPLTALQIGGGMYSHLSPPLLRNGLWHSLIHAATGDGANLPTNVYRVTSPDMLNWRVDPYGAELAIQPGDTVGGVAVDQRADAMPYEFGGNSYIVYDWDQNSSGYGALIRLAKFGGPLSRIWSNGAGFVPSAEIAASEATTQVGTRASQASVSTIAADYQQRGQPATLPTPVPTGYGAIVRNITDTERQINDVPG